ncbi:hypothetical protein [Aureimonas sp. D3]|uniref:hypothetical protein n=1 Tax=Aureimonas sp. D3 TaxID=1638164 RepID=UPI0012E3C7B0|nr:hypothetical protein [Aureimonas sp. D3]
MMSAVRKLERLMHRVLPSPAPELKEPQLACGPERPMTGFFAGLGPEQKRRALEYRGPENHGDLEFAN